MKPIKTILYAIFAISGLGMLSCSDMAAMDEYKEFLKEGEIVYTGKVDSVKVNGGKNRLQISMLLKSDPTIQKLKVYWNNRADSTEVAVAEGARGNRMEYTLDNMHEGAYNFEIFTLDGSGNKSVPVNASGRVYGTKYETALQNRPAKSIKWSSQGHVYIDWGRAESAVIGLLVTYTDKANVRKTLQVAADEATTELLHFQAGSLVELQTLYLPEAKGIDTFYAAKETAKVNEIILDHAGAGSPIAWETWDGSRFGIPKGWLVNEVVKNQKGYGGFDGLNKGAYLAMEKWSSSHTAIPNGKIWQTLTLAAGTYSLEATFQSKAVLEELYLVAAKGPGLPDIADIGSALGSSDYRVARTEFTLTEQTEVSLGFLANFIKDKQNFRASAVRLKIL